MPQPRKPTKVLEASGAFKKNPQRKRPNEPIVREPLGSPPDTLTAEERKAWMEFAEQSPTGVLTQADRQAVESASVLMAKFRASYQAVALVETIVPDMLDDGLTEETADQLIRAIKGLKSSFTAADYSQLRQFFAAFGMTPADRSRLSIPNEPKKGEFDGF
jgi:hypothetical protein